MFNWIKRRKWLVVNAVLVGVLISLLGVQVADKSDAIDRTVKIGVGNEKVITLGHIAYAAGSVDYTYDGVDDNVQFQAALDALPATGGRLVDVSAVQKNFSATVTRAIPNVTIEGTGAGSYFTNDGGTALFTAGGNNWKFADLRTHAGGITMGATTGWQWVNVTINATYYEVATANKPSTGIVGLTDTQELDNKTLDSSVAKGIWTSSGVWTIPAVTLGGLVNGNGQTIYGTSIYQNKSSTEAGYFDAVRNAANAGAGFVWRTFNNLDAITTRMQLSSGVATAILTLSNVTVNGLVLDGALTLNGQAFDAGAGSAEINTTGGGHGLTITSTQDGASGASLQLYQNSASPAASDVVGDILFYGEDSVGNKELYGRQRCEITDPTSTSEESAMKWTMVLGGTANLAMTLSGAGVLSPDHSIMFGQSQDSAAVADQVSLGGYEISAGHRALAISSEEVVVAAAAGASDAYLPVRINGVTYKLLLHN